MLKHIFVVMKSIYTLFLFFLVSNIYGQESLFDHLYEKGDTVVIDLNTDWKKLMRSKSKKEYRPVDLSMEVKDSIYSFSGRIRSRGNIRLVVCSNPSLKLKIKKKGLSNAGFDPSINDFKIVLQCTNSKLGQSYLKRERLVYGLHQIYSPDFHRTVPIVLKGLDNGKDVLGFFIESEEQLANRYERVIELKKISVRGLEQSSYVNMCLFNYLILNTDWHVFNSHNVELVLKEGESFPRPIPYDFDYSGFVGTSYALPREQLEISSIYVPKWLGKFITPEAIKSGAKTFLDKASEAQAYIESYPGLSRGDRKRMLKRLEEFNKVMASEKRLLKLLES